MSTFHEGPAHAKELVLRRAPIYLRVVVAASGKVDALDQPEDTPEAGEMVHVYRRRTGVSVIFACGRRGAGGRYEAAEYEWVPDVEGERLRDRAEWVKWCLGRPEARPKREALQS
jgi:hypothetical protein